MAFVGGFLLTTRTLRPSIPDEQPGLHATKQQLVQYAAYGISLGALPSMAGIGGDDLGPSWFFVIAIIACVVVLTRLIYPRTSQAPLVVEGIAVGLALLCLLPLGLPLQSLFYTMLIAAWLLFWVFLCCAVPFAAAGRSALAFYLLLACFAVGRLAAGALVQTLSAVSPAVAQGLLLALFCLALAIPLSEILESLKLAGGTAGDEGGVSSTPLSSGAGAGTSPSSNNNATVFPSPFSADGGKAAEHLASQVAGDERSNITENHVVEAAFPYERLHAICEKLGTEYGLTRREKEILCLLAQGRGRQYISEALVISEGTAKTHIKHVYAKLSVHSKDELLNLIHEHR